MTDKNSITTIDDYICRFDPEVQEKLQLMRQTIRDAVPEASEKISWQMPTFYLNGNLVHFAAHTNHIGFYPGASGIEAFSHRLTTYKNSKGAVQFPFNKPLPLDLVKEISVFRAAENTTKASK